MFVPTGRYLLNVFIEIKEICFGHSFHCARGARFAAWACWRAWGIDLVLSTVKTPWSCTTAMCTLRETGCQTDGGWKMQWVSELKWFIINLVPGRFGLNFIQYIRIPTASLRTASWKLDLENGECDIHYTWRTHRLKTPNKPDVFSHAPPFGTTAGLRAWGSARVLSTVNTFRSCTNAMCQFQESSCQEDTDWEMQSAFKFLLMVPIGCGPGMFNLNQGGS